MTGFRVEVDALGPVKIPADALYGAQTARALANFGVSGPRLADRPELIRGVAHVKAAAAQANAQLGILDPPLAELIVAAADELVAGRWHDQFPLALVQGGGGTSTNFAADEVIANRANQLLGKAPGRYSPVHPLDHVNRSQSTNDVHPTALQLATLDAAAPAIAALHGVVEALDRLGAEAGDLERLGRTCLQDALPLPVSAYHGGQAAALRRNAGGIAAALEPLRAVPIGATAVGTGLGTPQGYRPLVVEILARRTGEPLRPADDLFDALAHLDGLFAAAAAAAAAAMTLAKIAADLRLLASGPVGGIAEVRLPAVQVGSSIMPGKTNPVIPEHVMQLSYEIRGSLHVVESAVAAGELDLNVMEPVIARHLLESFERLALAADVLETRCLAGLEWDPETVELHLRGSLKTAVERAAEVGHDAVRAEEGAMH
jgi:aspartate ammonia-lyase